VVNFTGFREELARTFRLCRLFAYTATNMELRQLIGTADRIARQTIVPHLPVDFDDRYRRTLPTDVTINGTAVHANTSILRRSLPDELRRQNRERFETFRSGSATFLDQTVAFDKPAALDWQDERLSSVPALWRLKLHGFRPLWWAVTGFEDLSTDVDTFCLEWIQSWSKRNPIGNRQYLRREWTPYCVSQRLLYWSRYIAWRRHEGYDSDPVVKQSLLKNASFLTNHLEYDIGGNHLAENGAALIFTGCLTGDREWLKLGRRVLLDTAEQFLSDGGHFERSPMYHAIVLQRYLSVVNVLDEYECETGRLSETAQAGTDFLAALNPPDSTLPLLNDAVSGQSLPLKTCLTYGHNVGIEPSPQRVITGPNPMARALTDTGYYWFGDGQTGLLFDGGPVGPAHLPGHSHNDLLQVLWWVKGMQFVTDTGTYNYEAGARRQYARSIRAHNTVQVGDSEPIDIGGKYLMGRRTVPRVRWTHGDDVTAFIGWYKRHSQTNEYVHCRHIYTGDSWWFVWDEVRATNTVDIHSRLHLHPDVTVQETDGITLERDGTEATVIPLGVDGIDTDVEWYFPEFGVEKRRSVLDLWQTNYPPVCQGMLLTEQSYDHVMLDRTGPIPTELSIDGSTVSLPSSTIKSYSPLTLDPTG